MKKFLLIVLLFVGGVKSIANGCTPTIATGVVTGSPFCAGQALTVSYSFTDCVLPGNTFTLQLSDASGSFASPVNIGSVISVNAGSITGTIPNNTPSGTGYRVRVVSSTPAAIGTTNGTDFTIRSAPQVSFTINTNPQCINGNNFSFTNTSSFGSGTQTWQFGDGGTAATFNAARVYANSGIYSVKLIVTSTNGCKDSSTQSVTVNPKPTVSFTVNNTQNCAGIGFNFTNLSSINSGTNTYGWNFGDGNTSTQINPSHTYNTSGTYPVKLVATSNNGCKDSITFNSINVLPKPTAAFSINSTNACINTQNFVFTNNSTGAIASLLWSFGDGTTSVLLNPPSKTYATAGTYDVKLVVTGTNGCKDSIVQQVVVNNKPTVAFTFNNPSCTNTSIGLVNNSVLNSVSGTYNWIFGDGTTSTATNPTKSYPLVDGYILKLIVINSFGCRDSLSQNITINQKPTANFTINNGTQCVTGNSYTFTNNSTGAIANQIWYFGDGTTATTLNASKVYTTTGNYSVKLVVTGTNGCKDSITQTIQVTPIPNFIINNANQCFNGHNFIFTNASQGTIISNAWSFGDGSTSTATNPTKTYSANGTYTVKLVVTEVGGCKDSVSKTVTVSNAPIVNFVVDNNTKCAGTAFSFTNNSTGFAPLTYAWSFGDGGTSTATNPTYTYSSAGPVTVKLVVTNGSGCKDSASSALTVLPKPTSSFTINTVAQCVNGNNFSFTNTSIGSIASYNWSFGNGNTSNLANATQVYSTNGSFPVKLIATGTNGCKDSTTQNVTVHPKPFVSFTADNTSNCEGANFTLTNNTSIAGGSITYLWSFSDATSTTQFSPTKSFTTAGPATIKLVATSNNGCKDSASLNVTVLAKPVSSFTINAVTQCVNNNNFSFTNTSTGSITSSAWHFGDGSTSSQNNPTKVYTASAVFPVKLVITGTNGCKDSVIQNVTVASKPNPSFSVNNPTQCENSNSFIFTNTTSGSIASQTWRFGDGTTSSVANPTKNYTTNGTYTVKLIIVNASGCADSISQNVTVGSKPMVAYTINTITQCVNNNNYIFTNTSTGSIASQTWTYGNGNSSTTVNGATTYTSVGIFPVKLVVVGTNGCRDSLSQNVTVSAKPTPNFIVNTNSQCITGNNFIFTNNSTGSIASTTWYFGDGTTSTTNDPIKTYTTVGAFTVKLVVVNVNGCADSTTQVVNVLNKPVPNFTFASGGCFVNNQVAFNNTSTGGLNFAWDFGDGTTSNAQNPIKTFTTGSYTVKLIVTGTGACIDSISLPISVAPKPTAAFTINLNNQCIGSTYNFTNNSVGSLGSYAWDFGDGTTSTFTNPSKIYAAAGNYNVKLVFTSANGCKDSITQVANVLNKPNLAFNILGFVPCNFASPLSFINNSIGAATYLWSFGDGTTSTATNPTKSYASAGSYIIKLVGTGTGGCVDSIEQSITLQAKTLASYTVSPASNCVGNPFTFTNTTSGTLATQVWYFGDGTFSPLNNPTKAYATGGSYPVKLVITDVFGCKDSITQLVAVSNKPTVGFNFNGFNACSGSNTITFNNTSTGATNYLWDFGDGTTSTSTNTNVIKTFASKGVYVIKLVATSANGCKDSISQTINLLDKPTASFTANTVTQCLGGNNFIFTNTSTGSIADAVWYFGDGTFSPLANPSKAYAAFGVYTVKLVVTGTNGCKDSTTINVTVLDKPVTSFNLVGFSACSGSLSISLNNTTIGATGFVWNFGDGTTSTQTNPVKTYATTGSYVVKLVATNGSGCADSTQQTVNISPKPVASFITNAAIQCLENNNFTFTNTSTGSIATYLWNFGDGTTSNLASPSKAYSVAGTYIVKLFVTGANGCVDSSFTTLTVNPKPTANFALVGFTGCSNSNSISLNNTSTDAIAYLWNFGDGTTSNSTATTINKTYTTAGIYTVKLFATNTFGCVDSAMQTITITSKPIPSFTINSTSQCFNGNSFVFTNTSIPNGTPFYFWDFGDGTNSTVENPTKTYTSAGTFTIKYFLTNQNNCKDSVITTVTVLPRATAAFTINNATQCISGNSFVFNSSTSTNANQFAWSFGDGTTSTQNNPTKIYGAVGSYTVKLIITSPTNCKDSISQVITVVNSPALNFNTASTACSLSVGLTNTSLNATTFTWLFSDGTTNNEVNPTKIFATAGTYTIKLIGGNGSCVDSISRTITVTTKPTVGFTHTATNGCSNSLTVNFTNTSGTTINNWNFGDGTTSTANNPIKTFASYGIYTVKLIATNGAGCIDSVSQVITLQPKPIASFSVNTATQCLGNNNFIFTNNSTVAPGIVSYYWNFGDGTVSQDKDPNKVYLTAGAYTVTLFVTNANGCKDTTTRNIIVSAKPQAAFTINNFNPCSSTNTFSFNNSSLNAVSYVWKFGDGTTSILSNPTKIYTAVGTYTVTLIATNLNGCTDSVSQVINMAARPIASFTLSSITGCVNTTITTTNTSTALNNPTYLWQFGDGSTSNLAVPTKQYTTSGSFTIRLIVTNGNGCSDTAIQFINIVAKPQAVITTSNTSQCFAGNSFTLSGSNSTNAATYLWRFSDGTTLSGVNVVKSFTTPVTFPTAWLIVTSSTGCVDSTIQSLNLLASPIANYTFVQDACGNNVTFTNTSSTNATGFIWNFGDGTTANTASPIKNYTTPGTYIVSLVATNGSCIDSIRKTIVVGNKPKASFNSNYTACTNSSSNTVNFVNTSTGSISTFSWDFGDGTTSNVANPTKTFTNYGVFVVKLVVTNTFGCADSSRQIISYGLRPTASFTTNSNIQCLNNNQFVFIKTSNNDVGDLWNFGDGTTSFTADPLNKTYATAGNYVVKLYVTNGFGCTDSAQTLVSVTASPIANFVSNNTAQCLKGNNFILTATTPVVGNTYNWKFSDSTTATGTSVNKSFSRIASYSITLIATNASGCKDSTTQVITILPSSVASFVANVDSCTQTVSFVNNSTGGTQGFPYLWQFGDGTTSQLPNPVKTYTTSGTYVVKLVVINRACSDSTSKVVTISTPVKAAFTAPNYTACSNNAIASLSFNNSSTGSIQNYLWDFGDGSFSNLANPIKSFVAYGTYTVKLVVTSTNGCKDSVSQTFILGQKPMPAFGVNNLAQCLGTNSFSFTNISTGNPASFIWNFGDGTTSSLINPTKTYSTAGVYLVKLFAIGSTGCIDSAVQQITVYPRANANFSINNQFQCIQGNVFNYTSLATPGTIAAYSWNLGDTSFSVLPNITKVYTRPGNYTITLTTQSFNGCVDSVKQVITVYAKPTSQFTTTGVTCAGNAIAFSNTTITSNLTTGYIWYFGDGTQTNDANPTKIYNLPGTYIVKLVAVNIGGCRDSLSQTVTILPRPTARFTLSDSLVCSGTTINFTNSSTGSITSYLWTFGDGTTSTLLNASKTYLVGGTYTVSLTVTGTNGCQHTVSRTIVVASKPSVSFVVNAQNQCITTNSFAFGNTSTNVDANTRFLWNFGDGNVSTNPLGITKSYVAVGPYKVLLTATNNGICIDSASMIVNVNPLPAAQISGTQTICAGGLATLNFSLLGSAPWNIVYTDGSSNFAINKIRTPNYSINIPVASTRTFRLVSVVDSSNCNQPTNLVTGSATVTIDPNFAITQQPRDTGACFNGSASFTVRAVSTNPITYQWRKNGVNIAGAIFNTLALTNLTILDAATYTCAVTSSCGTVITDSAKLMVDLVPPPPAVTPLSLCQNVIAAPLTAIGNNLKWYTMLTGGIGSVVAPIPNTSGIGIQNYYVSASSNYCESNRSLLQVTVLTRPAISIAVNPTTGILPTQSATITVTSNPIITGTNFRWFYNGALNSLSSSNQLAVPFDKLGKYHAEVILPNGCNLNTDTVTVKAKDNFALALAQGKLFITPNPAKTVAGVYFNAPINQVITLRLVDGLGKVLQTQTVNNLAPFQRVNFDVRRLITGYYGIEVLDERGRNIARDILLVTR